jgi:hypothetical protein
MAYPKGDPPSGLGKIIEVGKPNHVQLDPWNWENLLNL